MLRHVAMFRWAPGTSTGQVAALESALQTLPAAIPALRDYRVGSDAGLREGNWDFVVVADLDDADGWRAYVDHPAHQRVLAELLRPLLGERASVQFEW
ncbi:MAG TPA: Dabb family protein [Acidimicrobiales bacterium]|nr:Dabb family protein [Acidimicrobiales bacterium]